MEKQIKDTRDKKPIVTAQMHEHALKAGNYSGKELYTDPEKLVDGISRVYQLYDVNYPSLGYDVYNIEAEALGQSLEFRNAGSPLLDKNNPVIKEKGDFRKIKLKSPLRDQGRFGFVVSAIEKYVEKFGLMPPFQFTAPFSLASQIYGIENLLMAMILDPVSVHEILKRVTHEVCVPWIEFQRGAFSASNPAYGADALASPPNLNLSMLEEFVVPYIEALKDACGQNVGVVNWWGEGCLENPEQLFELKRKVSPNSSILQVQDPDLAGMDPGMAAWFAGKHNLKLTFGVGAGFLSLAGPEEIRERVAKYVSAGGAVPGFTLYLCNLGVDTSAENIRIAISAARECFN